MEVRKGKNVIWLFLKISTTISMKKFSSRAFDWWLHLEQPLKIQKLRSSPDLPSLPIGVSFYSEGGKKEVENAFS